MRAALLLACCGALASAADTIQFGIYGLEASPGANWQLMAAADYVKYKTEFITAYNKAKGVPTIKVFQSGNCCFAVKGGDKLIISGTPYKYQFPASVSGGIRCNPSGGYSESHYQFYRVPTLPANAVFSSKAACSTSKNPAIYMKLPLAKAGVEFGLYDHEVSPGGGWEIATAAIITIHKAKFIATYNKNKGLAPIKTFQSGNCCIAVKGGEKAVHGM